MYRRSPLMRSLLSQFRTPTDPRRSVCFFRFSRLASRPARLITQSTSDRLVLLCPPFRPSTPAKLTEHSQKSTQSFGALVDALAVHNPKYKSLERINLVPGSSIRYAFYTERFTSRQDPEREPNNRLDAVEGCRHLRDSREYSGSDARTGGLCRRRMPGESGSFRHWSCDPRHRGRSGSDRQMDRPSG